MATNDSKNKTYTASPGEVARETEIVTTSAKVASMLRSCDSQYAQHLRDISKWSIKGETKKNLASKDYLAPLPKAFTDTLSDTVIAQRLILQEWTKQNEVFIQNKIIYKSIIIQDPPEEDSTWAWNAQRKRHILRCQIVAVLRSIHGALAEMSIHLNRRTGQKSVLKGRELDKETDETKIRRLAANLAGYNKILQLLTETMGDEGPAGEEKACLDVETSCNEDLYRGFGKGGPPKEGAPEDMERHHDKSPNEELVTKGQLKEALMQILNVFLKGNSKKNRS